MTIKFRAIPLALIMTTVLPGCNSNGTSTFGGSVGDGPVANARVLLKNAAGDVVAETVSNGQAKYSFSVAVKRSDYPLTIEAAGGTDLVTGRAPDIPLESVVLSPGSVHANINPHSTLIVKTAEHMAGGVTPENVELAKQIVLDNFSFGLDPATVPDPLSTPVGENNVAEIVKASEAMAEAIRRTSKALNGVGDSVNTEGVFEKLAADLSDGRLDGAGDPKADPRVTAVALAATAEVLVESMENRLEVDSVVATGALDNAIQTTTPYAKKRTKNVRISAKMIDEAKAAIEVAEAVDGSGKVSNLRANLGKIAAKSTPETVENAIPHDVKTQLRSVAKRAARADRHTLESAVQKVAKKHASKVRIPTTPPSQTYTQVSGGNGGAGSPGAGKDGVFRKPEAAPRPAARQPASRKVVLTWVAPDRRTDGKPLSLSELDGYRIYCGKSGNDLKVIEDVNDGSVTRYTLNNAPSSCSVFAVTAYDQGGRESSFSNRKSL